MKNHVERIFEQISCADKQGIVDATIFDSSPGLSGRKVVGLLQRLTSIFNEDGRACYLEIGVFRGLSLLSTAISSPSVACFGIDNFAFHDPDNANLKYVNACVDKYELSNTYIINQGFEEAFSELGSHIGEKKIAVYFIDGPHDYRSQNMCLALALPYMHEHAVIVVDDSNYRHVRQANSDFLKTHTEWKLAFEAYTHCHPYNMDGDLARLAKDGWWNGINVLVRDRADKLIPIYPPTHPDRELYENENLVHAARIPEFSPQMVDFFQRLFRLKVLKAGKLFLSLIGNYFQRRDEFGKRFESMNTFSAGLTNSRYAQNR